MPGSHNDINVLERSPVFRRLCNGESPPDKYTVNNPEYNMRYYLADDIYPQWENILPPEAATPASAGRISPLSLPRRSRERRREATLAPPVRPSAPSPPPSPSPAAEGRVAEATAGRFVPARGWMASQAASLLPVTSGPSRLLLWRSAPRPCGPPATPPLPLRLVGSGGHGRAGGGSGHPAPDPVDVRVIDGGGGRRPRGGGGVSAGVRTAPVRGGGASGGADQGVQRRR
nr:translation initiation factor IF-2-like [Aegilops tauschii subsp. strangulata]